ncbi:hypothetical protein [Candidatus Frankia alpina]|uniref:hypothetical protein n=1 Tax=Candidatus Frankia alpina TaxID=2699483 RepID=UPI0013D82B45|nr:hypothetical protein [Candidatus Frankia alpina]
MPRLPRFDPLWLIIPAIALLIAVGWPTRVPINPRGSGPPATIMARPVRDQVQGSASAS